MFDRRVSPLRTEFHTQAGIHPFPQIRSSVAASRGVGERGIYPDRVAIIEGKHTHDRRLPDVHSPYKNSIFRPVERPTLEYFRPITRYLPVGHQNAGQAPRRLAGSRPPDIQSG